MSDLEMSDPMLSDATLDLALQEAEAAIHAVRLERPNANDGKLAYVALKAALPVWREALPPIQMTDTEYGEVCARAERGAFAEALERWRDRGPDSMAFDDWLELRANTGPGGGYITAPDAPDEDLPYGGDNDPEALEPIDNDD